MTYEFGPLGFHCRDIGNLLKNFALGIPFMNLSLTGKEWVDFKRFLMYICFLTTLIRALRLVMPFEIILLELEIFHHLSLPPIF